MPIHIINPKTSNRLTDGERYTLNEKLKKIMPDNEDENIYVYIQPVLNGRLPDFVVIGNTFGIIVIEVKDWSDNYLITANKQKVVCDKKSYRNPSSQVLGYVNYIKNNLTKIEEFIDIDGECNIPIRAAVFFVNLSHEKLKQHEKAFFNDKVSLFDRSALRSLSYEKLIGENKRKLSDQEIFAIRGAVFPEIVLPNKEPKEKDQLTSIKEIKVLDKDQEEFAKKLPSGHYMVSGLPGSGKTIMLISRAIYIAQNTRSEHLILILTYTKALSKKLESQITNKISEMGLSERILHRIEVKTFHKLCYDLVGKPRQPPNRKGEDYWNEFLPKQAIQAARTNEEIRYTSILIDEYQDFHANWFDLCKAVCVSPNSKDGNLFLAGDRLQRIYEVPWKSYKDIGLNIVGRSKLLKNSYRTNENHMDFALQFLANDPTLKKDISNFYELDKLNEIKDLSHCLDFLSGSSKKASIYLTDLIVKLGIEPSDILVLCHNRYEISELMNSLPDHIQPMFVSGKEPIDGKALITTYYSAKGMEAKYCLLMSINKFDNKKLDRTLMYVGMTRASERLAVHYDECEGFALEFQVMLSQNDVNNTKPLQLSEKEIEALY